jgi:hypothetical protein
MNSHNQSKINQLLKHWPRGTVAVQAWLQQQNIYRQLAESYQQGGWIDRVGYGAYIQTGDHVDWTGALYALQFELGMKVHIAAITALEMQGYAHFVPLGGGHSVWLFNHAQEIRDIPLWFIKWSELQSSLKVVTRKLFQGNWQLGLTEKKMGEYRVILSSPERAIMEYLDLVPQQQSLEQGYLLMESLQTLRPTVIQELLENCTSVKVKRLFMCLAEREAHQWLKKLDLTRVNFGSGKRVIGRGGKLNRKYNLSLPSVNTEEEDESHDDQ